MENVFEDGKNDLTDSGAECTVTKCEAPAKAPAVKRKKLDVEDNMNKY